MFQCLSTQTCKSLLKTYVQFVNLFCGFVLYMTDSLFFIHFSQISDTRIIISKLCNLLHNTSSLKYVDIQNKCLIKRPVYRTCTLHDVRTKAISMARTVQSVQRLAIGWMVQGSNCGGGRDFPHPSRLALETTQPPVQ